MQLFWAVQAEADLYEIADYYAGEDEALADEMLSRIYDAPLILLERPWIGPPTGFYDLRKWLVRRSPFVLLYRVLDDVVEVARVVHGASDWQNIP